ncbi:hypothetical protein TRFO_34901 [Tritrichomonas foetus]|uniref:Uncharacterized protein n=1 Tax=Tritrichomonas foetus TaxID=1144522 RepID=A0A1J4JJ79_9EUKA|nr:hypothetical protein TRFO_34901 [Tritrichomonas foetus]|eukprot:OHS98649.1 hypothetical protein TRFO_34901 [Tritrichomonas foetus]
MKQASINYVQFDDKSSCIIASLPQRNDTQVIYIDQIMGTLMFTGIKGYDVFDSKNDAFKFLTKNKKLINAVDAHSILGYIISDKVCHLLLVEKASKIDTIFEKHVVYAIEKVNIINIPTEMSCSDANYVPIETIANYPFQYSHFFCQTFDLSKAFGKSTAVRSVWNEKFQIPFNRLPVSNICISLFQGIIRLTKFSTDVKASLLFVASHQFPKWLLPQGTHKVKEHETGIEYLIDIFLIKHSENGYEILNHSLQIGDFPFNWSFDQGRYSVRKMEACIESVKNFVLKQKDLWEIDGITFSNFFSNQESPEHILSETLEDALNNDYNCDTAEYEWIQSERDADKLDYYIQMLWPQVYSKIQKFGFNKSISNHADTFHILSKQVGMFRFVFGLSFEREILGLFFFTLGLLEKMCEELRFKFPNHLVTTEDLHSFADGFIYCTGNFLLEFSQSFSNFTNVPSGEIERSLIFNYMKPRSVSFSKHQINYANTMAAIDAIKNLQGVRTFAVTQSPSSFVFSENISNVILKPNIAGYTEIAQKDKPIILCLSEPCYIREVVLRNVNVTRVSISGGLRLNRTFPIAKKVMIPWVPKDGNNVQGPYIRIPLKSTSIYYDHDIRPHDYEKVRFLILNFKTYRNEPLRIGSLFAFGTPQKPGQVSKEVNFQFKLDVSTPIKYEGDVSKTDTFVSWEISRLKQNASYLDLQKHLIEKNMPIDSADFDKMLIPPKVERELHKAICAKCQSKDQCIDCINCNRPFCKKCLNPRKHLKLCEYCLSARESLLLHVSRLNSVRFLLINVLYPFIGKHNEQMMPLDPKALDFNDINRPPIAAYAYEPPIPSRLSVDPETLFVSNLNWPVECNMMQMNIIFTCESQVTGLHISCNTLLKVTVEGAEPSQLEFKPPGCLQKIKYCGRMAKVTISAKKISMHHIQFVGNFIPSDPETHQQENQATKPRRLNQVKAQAQFNRAMSSHEFRFASPVEVSAVKYSHLSHLPKDVVIEFKSDKNSKMMSRTVASLSAHADGMALLVFPSPIPASTLRLFYPGLSPQLAQIYANDIPEIMIPQKIIHPKRGK